MPALSSRRAASPPRAWTPGPGPYREREAFARPVETSDQLKLSLLGQITRLEQDLAQLRGRLQALEAASGPVVEAPPRRRRNPTPRPALAPLILSLLPADGALVSIDTVISGLLEAEHIDVEDRPARSKAYRRANLCLNKQRAEGRVVSNRIGSGRLDWGLAPAGAQAGG
jgi:hypothetical protein